MRQRLVVASAVLALSVPRFALADEDCPEDWFCERADVDGFEDEDAAAPSERGTPPEVVVPRRTTRSPPVVVYYPYEGDEPPKKPKIVVDREENRPKPPKRRHRLRHGLNLRLQGVLMGRDENRHPDAGMGGVGVSYRYRPTRNFALDAGLDYFLGNDFNGFERRETAVTLNGIVYFNPRDPVQLYGLAGIGFAGARVEAEELGAPDRRFGYFGMQTGLGLEIMIGKSTALNFDVIGFIRGRTDHQAAYRPEFVDPATGRATNTSGGGLVRGGLTFYW